ncbi:MAG: hypothetical protein IKW35_00200 [Paludibacteraceae bacterium]|nr:hypothetical protein [Paludibacteraceae bacterium]
MAEFFKNQRGIFLGIPVAYLFLSLCPQDWLWTNALFVLIALVSILMLYLKIRRKKEVGLFDILGTIMPVLFSMCVNLTIVLETALYIYWILLLVSMIICMCTCKEEDTKSIALLHVMYMTSCALAVPVWLTIK